VHFTQKRKTKGILVIYFFLSIYELFLPNNAFKAT
jgi:hypothetical protein